MQFATIDFAKRELKPASNIEAPEALLSDLLLAILQIYITRNIQNESLNDDVASLVRELGKFNENDLIPLYLDYLRNPEKYIELEDFTLDSFIRKPSEQVQSIITEFNVTPSKTARLTAWLMTISDSDLMEIRKLANKGIYWQDCQGLVDFLSALSISN